jgi:mannosidase alpha-like ER degradation enhancer 1
MYNAQPASVIVDSLSAFMPAVHVLTGDLESAIKVSHQRSQPRNCASSSSSLRFVQAHSVFAYQWKRYHANVEMYDINKRAAAHKGWPLRPEHIESNLYLYTATKDEWYLELAEEMLLDIRNRTWTDCGLAAILDVTTR